MIKRALILFLILSLALVFTGCLNIHIGDGKMVVGNGEMTSKTVPVEQGVTGLNNMGSIDVVIDPSLDGEAVIEGESNIIDLVKLEQDASGALTVSFKDNVSISMNRGVTVRIPAVNGGTIQLDGSGSISLEGSSALKGDSFSVRVMGSGDIRLMTEAAEVYAIINGSGNVNLDVKTQQLIANIEGSGDISVKGSADRVKASINGSGNIDTLDCAASAADVMVAGSGDIAVNVSSELTGSINGSGDVFYTGNPGTVSVSNNGSGDLIKR